MDAVAETCEGMGRTACSATDVGDGLSWWAEDGGEVVLDGLVEETGVLAGGVGVVVGCDIR